MAFNIRQNPFSAGALPRTPLGELPIGHRPTFGARHASPSEFQPDLRLCPQDILMVTTVKREKNLLNLFLTRTLIFTARPQCRALY